MLLVSLRVLSSELMLDNCYRDVEQLCTTPVSGVSDQLRNDILCPFGEILQLLQL